MLQPETSSPHRHVSSSPWQLRDAYGEQHEGFNPLFTTLELTPFLFWAVLVAVKLLASNGNKVRMHSVKKGFIRGKIPVFRLH